MRCLHNSKEANVAKTDWVSEQASADEKSGKSVWINSDHQVKEDFLDFYTFVEFLAKISDVHVKIITLSALQSIGHRTILVEAGRPDRLQLQSGGLDHMGSSANTEK